MTEKDLEDAWERAVSLFAAYYWVGVGTHWWQHQEDLKNEGNEDWFKSPVSNVPLWNDTTYPDGSFIPYDSRGRPRKKFRL